MENITIEKMNLEDIADSKNLEVSQEISLLSDNSIREDLSKDNCYYITAKSNGKIVGYLGVSYLIDTAEILSIIVEKNEQKKGIATLMLDNLFKFLKCKNIKQVFLEVRQSNIAAQNLYLKHEFTKISIRKNYYKNEDAIIMKKEL